MESWSQGDTSLRSGRWAGCQPPPGGAGLAPGFTTLFRVSFQAPPLPFQPLPAIYVSAGDALGILKKWSLECEVSGTKPGARKHACFLLCAKALNSEVWPQTPVSLLALPFTAV